MELEFEINNQSMNRIDKNKPADFSNKYLLCKFNFLSNDWSEDFTKFAIFKTNKANYRVTILEDECYVPFDVLEHRRFVITVYGVNAEDVRITTNQVWLRLEDSGFVTSYDESGEFNPDMTEQIWLAMDEKSDISYVDTELSGKSDVGHSHSKSDITDFSHNHDERYYTETETDTLLNGKVDKVTGKGLSSNDFTEYYKNFLDGFDGDIEAFLEEHKAEIEALITSEVLDGKADKVHSHTESDITDLKDYALADGVYSKSEVDALIDKVENKFFVTSDAPVIQSGENCELFAKMKSEGFPVTDKTVHFYEPVLYCWNSPDEDMDINLGASNYKVYISLNHFEDTAIQIGDDNNRIMWQQATYDKELLCKIWLWKGETVILEISYEGDFIKIKNNVLYYGAEHIDLNDYDMNVDFTHLIYVVGEVIIKELEEE